MDKRSHQQRGPGQSVRRHADYEAFTPGNVLVGVSAAFPVKIANEQFVGVTEQQKAAYSVTAEMLPNIAEFFTALMCSPRYNVAAGRNKILGAFENIRAPPSCGESYLRGTALNSHGSVELARLHVVALRQIRRQLMPFNSVPGALPPFNTRIEGGPCPFGQGCLMLFYSRLLSKIIPGSLDGIPSFIRKATRIGDKVSVAMEPVSVHPRGCVCPYSHSETDTEIHDALVDRVYALIMEKFEEAAWYNVNDAPYNILPASMREHVRAGGYSLEIVKAAIAAIGPQERDAIFSQLVVAGLDNVSDQMLLPMDSRLGSRTSAPAVDEALYNSVMEEYKTWVPNQNDGAEKMPYMARMNLRIPLNIQRVTSGSVIANLMRKIQRTEEEPQATTSQVSLAAPTTAAAAPTTAAVASPTQPQRYPAGMRAPIHGTMMIPRYVTDEYLESNRYDFRAAFMMTHAERARYTTKKLRDLFIDFLPNLSEHQALQMAERTFSHYGGDPYVLFDDGRAYLSLTEMILSTSA